MCRTDVTLLADVSSSKLWLHSAFADGRGHRGGASIEGFKAGHSEAIGYPRLLSWIFLHSHNEMGVVVAKLVQTCAESIGVRSENDMQWFAKKYPALVEKWMAHTRRNSSLCNLPLIPTAIASSMSRFRFPGRPKGAQSVFLKDLNLDDTEDEIQGRDPDYAEFLILKHTISSLFYGRYRRVRRLYQHSFRPHFCFSLFMISEKDPIFFFFCFYLPLSFQLVDILFSPSFTHLFILFSYSLLPAALLFSHYCSNLNLHI